MSYCRNPTCPRPNNPDSNKFCRGCGLELSVAPLFRERYRVLKILGQGSFGRTYAAEDLDCMNRPCVVKKFIAKVEGSTLEKAQQLFEHEAKQLYDLDHPQIPRLYGYFEHEGSLYLVQQFIEGQNLLKIFKKQGPFSERQILIILRDLLPVIQYLHDRNVLHRDIKPENIMRPTPSKPGEGKKLVLIDFGGAKEVTGTRIAGAGTAIYTPGYGAMEQMMGRPTRSSDLYSLGATCIRLLTGCLPAGKNREDEVFDSINFRWLWRERLQERGISLNHHLAEIFDNLLQTFPQNRYQSATEVFSILEEVIAKFTNKSSEKPQPQQQPKQKQKPEDETVIIVHPDVPPSEEEIDSDKEKINHDTEKFQFQVTTVNTQGEEITSEQKEAEYFTEELADNILLHMIFVSGGKFLFGSTDEDGERLNNEIPQHLVTVPSFFMSKYPITQAQWQAVMNYNPSKFTGKNRPVEQVSWYEAVEFCQRLSTKINRKFRLPSEVEWEYACRGGTNTPFHFGETITTDLVNYDGHCHYGSGPKGSYRKKTTIAGNFPPNAFGLYDMHGNVREWCANIWQELYNGLEDIDPKDPRDRSLRGGSWVDHPVYCRSTSRYGVKPDIKSLIVGFRIVCAQ